MERQIKTKNEVPNFAPRVAKKKKKISVGKHVEKLEPSYAADGSVKSFSVVENHLVIPQKVKHKITT